MPPKITLHHLVHSPASRVFWCLEELGLKYNVQVHYRGQDGKPPASLKAVSKLGKAPVLQIDNETLKESGSIIHTLLLRHAREGIETPPGDSSVYWSHFSEGSLMLYLVASRNSAFLHQILTESAQTDEERSGMKRHHDAMVAWAKSNVQPALEETDMFIDQKGNFTGDKDLIGEGDFMMSYPLNTVAEGMKQGKNKDFYLEQSTMAWVERMRARPAWKKAEERRLDEEQNQKK